jgi:hypothetical protein
MMNDMMPRMMLAMGLFWLLDHYCFDPGSRQALHQIPSPRTTRKIGDEQFALDWRNG